MTNYRLFLDKNTVQITVELCNFQNSYGITDSHDNLAKSGGAVHIGLENKSKVKLS